MKPSRVIPIKRQAKAVCAVLALLGLLSAGIPPTSTAAQRRTAVVRAVEKAGKAVVNIRTEQVVKRRSASFFGFTDPFFDEFFNRFAAPRTFRTQSIGSGVLIDAAGHILTNNHVIEKASRIFVALPGESREREAELVGRAEDLDLAVLRISRTAPFPFVALTGAGDLMLGETVIAIGNPLGLGHSVTTGIVSATTRRIAVEEGHLALFIQTDALINPGNSGGPLLNINGELIGINTAIASQAQGIGFAIPATVIGRVLDDLLEHGRARHAYLGIYPVPVGERFSSARGAGGVLVSGVEAGSPADGAGLRFGDVIIRFADLPIATLTEFASLFDTYTPGDTVDLEILRGAETRHLKITLSELPKDYGLQYAQRVFGLSVRDGSRGVTVDTVRIGTTASEVGIIPGDLIAEVEGETVESTTDFSKVVASLIGREPLRFLVIRGNRGYYIELP